MYRIISILAVIISKISCLYCYKNDLYKTYRWILINKLQKNSSNSKLSKTTSYLEFIGRYKRVQMCLGNFDNWGWTRRDGAKVLEKKFGGYRGRITENGVEKIKIKKYSFFTGWRSYAEEMEERSELL